MTNSQVTLVQIDNYGPWTVTPAPRREVDLQSLQASLYADLARAFGDHEGYIFFTRFDNMVAITNGIDRADHRRIQESIGNRYPVSISLSIAADRTPTAALRQASGQLQDAGSAQDGSRREILRGTPLAHEDRREDDVQIAHFDVIDATSKYTDELDAFESFVHIERGYLALLKYLRNRHESLTFFVGGDNMIAVCSGLEQSAFESAVEHVRSEVGLGLQVGVGVGATAGMAGMTAKHALEACREDGTSVEVSLPVAQGD